MTAAPPRSGEAPDFDARYRDDPDPFDVETSWYERRKEAIALALLPRARYRLAWDAAAGTGALSRALAERADAVVASDASAVAVERMRERCLEAEVAALPTVPDAARGCQLCVLAEVLYYLPEDARAATLEAVGAALAPGGDLLAVHWTGDGEDLAISGAALREELDAALGTGSAPAAGWRLLASLDDEDFSMRVWRRT